MSFSKATAIQLWFDYYGNAMYAEDFDGGLMYREAYGDPDYYIFEDGQKIYCGWNLHHILPKSCGGTSDRSNLLCTNILTNEAAGNKITFWIDNSLYQVKRNRQWGRYNIIRIGEREHE